MDAESEITVAGSELVFGSVKLEVEGDQAEAESALLQDTWTPQTAKNTATKVGVQFNRIAEENIQIRMARIRR